MKLLGLFHLKRLLSNPLVPVIPDAVPASFS
jgi:hypothetical protein